MWQVLKSLWAELGSEYGGFAHSFLLASLANPLPGPDLSCSGILIATHWYELSCEEETSNTISREGIETTHGYSYQSTN
jgi:hypothetical protein